MSNKFHLITAGVCLMLLLACGPKENQPSQNMVAIIPTPVELTVNSGSI